MMWCIPLDSEFKASCALLNEMKKAASTITFLYTCIVIVIYFEGSFTQELTMNNNLPVITFEVTSEGKHRAIIWDSVPNCLANGDESAVILDIVEGTKIQVLNMLSQILETRLN